MKRIPLWAIPIFAAGLSYISAGSTPVLAQAPTDPPAPAASGSAMAAPPPGPIAGPVVLDWVPAAMAQLSAQAAAKSSFTLDRNMLAAAASISGADDQTRQAVSKLDGVSVHMLNFGSTHMADPAEVDSIREAYHLRGWKHLVSSTGSGGPVHDGTADVWLVLDGANVRGAVVLVDTPRSLTLVTLAGNLSPVDLLHLRGHFGIPRFEGDRLRDSHVN